MEDCIFCKIINKEIAVEPVFENDQFIVINDKFPKAEIHMLVIPKEHIGSIGTLDQSQKGMLGEALILAKEVAAQKGIVDYKLLLNNGRHTEVPHLHLHLISGENLPFVV
jgi:histidine triad (HIT) family protein